MPSSHAVFLYGTLCFRDLLELVLGRPLAEGELRPATLRNHAVYWVKDQIFPKIVEEQGATANGVVFEPNAEDLRRMDYYEGGFDYDLIPVSVEGIETPVDLYVTNAPQWAVGAPWDLSDFIRDHGDLTLKTAKMFMALYGHVDRAEAMKRLPMLRAVAAKSYTVDTEAQVTIRSGLGQKDVELLTHQRGFEDFYAMDQITLRHRRFDGSWSEEIERSCLISVDVAIVLPYDPIRDRVMLVEQFRIGPFIRNDLSPWMLEPVAGRIDAGEDAETAARREAEEEAGLTIAELHRISQAYPSPGLSNEYYHCFLGIADIGDDAGGTHGLAEEGENIRSHILSFDELMALLDSGEAEAGPTVLCALWLARHRDAIRARAGVA